MTKQQFLVLLGFDSYAISKSSNAVLQLERIFLIAAVDQKDFAVIRHGIRKTFDPAVFTDLHNSGKHRKVFLLQSKAAMQRNIFLPRIIELVFAIFQSCLQFLPG